MCRLQGHAFHERMTALEQKRDQTYDAYMKLAKRAANKTSTVSTSKTTAQKSNGSPNPLAPASTPIEVPTVSKMPNAAGDGSDTPIIADTVPGLDMEKKDVESISEGKNSVVGTGIGIKSKSKSNYSSNLLILIKVTFPVFSHVTRLLL